MISFSIGAIVQMQSDDFNKFLTIQLKIQKARDGFEVRLVTPIELDAILYLTYDLRQFILKPSGVCSVFEAIVLPILAITSMTTTEPSTVADTNPQVHLRMSLPPFDLSIAFSSDYRSFSTFVESVEFLRMTLNPGQMAPAQREIHELRKANDDLQTTVDSLRTVKLQQEDVIQELARLLAKLSDTG
jgi:hypothetical protein